MARSAAVPGCGLCIAALLSVASRPERLKELLKVKEKEVGRSRRWRLSYILHIIYTYIYIYGTGSQPPPPTPP